MRVFAISDVHVDYDENARWVAGLSNQDYVDDAIILAGDVSDVDTRIAECFEHFAHKFRYVFFVPGNHDLWVTPGSQQTSIDKFKAVLKLAHACGVVTEPRTLGDVTIVPLLSWYDYSFGEPGEFLLNAWMDYRRCIWPEALSSDAKISEFFLKKNEPRIAQIVRKDEECSAGRDPSSTIISFSHFLPRIDVMPSYIPADKRQIYPVLGSSELDKQVRELGAHIHIYGHSHVNRSIELDGVHYINNALAYPNENRIARKRLISVFDEVGKT